MKRRLQIVAVALAFGFALSGCGNDSGRSSGSASAGTTKSTESTKESGMDMQEAAERSDGMLDAVLKEIDPEVQWAHGPTTTGSCDVTRRRTVMTIVSAERRQSFLDQVEKFWRKSDYRIKAKNNDKEFPAVYAQTKAGFGISVSFRGKGQAFFEADSPCVKESKVADSTSKPNGPAYEGVYPLPRPNVHSDYWSAGTS
ncbi:hypothetical protein [Streptomyces sp. BE133]|uniref:hypothetical protein n=1 Tax=Streptomyces sp. BE133 TaxID=3002523 RepID=UPI002E77F1E8|nr:hypothetical protein [Streptomyces sp. BE133]MEE1810301.1 hypothetical protein [Streptomyces sp. BE133]